MTPHLRAIDAGQPHGPLFPGGAGTGYYDGGHWPGSANPIAGQFCAMKTLWPPGGRHGDPGAGGPEVCFGENPKTVYNDKNQTPNTRMATAALIREELHKAQRGKERIWRPPRRMRDADEPDFDAKWRPFFRCWQGRSRLTSTPTGLTISSQPCVFQANLAWPRSLSTAPRAPGRGTSWGREGQRHLRAADRFPLQTGIGPRQFGSTPSSLKTGEVSICTDHPSCHPVLGISAGLMSGRDGLR